MRRKVSKSRSSSASRRTTKGAAKKAAPKKRAVKKVASKKAVKKVPIKKGKKKVCGKACKKRIQHKGFILALSSILVGTSLFFTISAGNIFNVVSYSSNHLKNVAKKYIEGREQVNAPITISYKGKDYYYVPFTVNGNLNSTFPGIMLDSKAKPVTNKNTLMELFRYPGVINETVSMLKDFNSVVNTKASAVKQYCKIVNSQENKLRGIVASGSFVGLMYYSAQVAFDGVSMVKTGVKGLGALVLDLAQGHVQDSIVSYFTSWDSKAALNSAYKAHEAAKKTSRYCAQARTAWLSLKTTSGSITPEKAKNATCALEQMFYYEKDCISNLRLALKRINNYPKVITKIGKSDYTNGMAGLDNLVSQLYNENKYWRQECQDAGAFLKMWAELQIIRVKGSTPTDCHGSKKLGHWSYCSTACPCDAGEGDCDNDKHCKAGTKCIDNVGAKYGLDKDMDICEKVTTAYNCHKQPKGGWSYCTKDCPCDTGEGDCDKDYQCKPGLKCVQNNGKKFGYRADLDVCEGVSSTPAPVPAPTSCHGSKKKGSYSYCSSKCQCDAGQGDCDNDKECKSGLKCVNNVGKKYGYSSDVDVCEKPSTTPAPTTRKGKNGSFNYCTRTNPCGKGQGDCDSDRECKSGLKCVNNVGKKYGWNWTVDVCE